MISTLVNRSRLLVIWRGAVVAYVIQVDGEFGGVEGFALPQILARRDDFVPGFEGHISVGA